MGFFCIISQFFKSEFSNNKCNQFLFCLTYCKCVPFVFLCHRLSTSAALRPFSTQQNGESYIWVHCRLAWVYIKLCWPLLQRIRRGDSTHHMDTDIKSRQYRRQLECKPVNRIVFFCIYSPRLFILYIILHDEI